MALSLTSPAFENDELIPPRYTCDGENINPPFYISGVPEGSRSLVLLMDDPDVPKAVREDQMFDHWVLFNIPPETKTVGEHAAFGTPGANTRGDLSYTGPCPPPQYEPKVHRYFFRLYALDSELHLPRGTTKEDVIAAMNGCILAQAELMGRYARA